MKVGVDRAHSLPQCVPDLASSLKLWQSQISQRTPLRLEFFVLLQSKTQALKDYLFYKTLMHQAPTGYARLKILPDDTGNPVDYIFLEVNKAFEELTGLSADDTATKKQTLQPYS